METGAVLISKTRGDSSPDGGFSTCDAVLEHYQADVYRFAVHLTRDCAEANDLYKETLRQAVDAFDARDRPENYRSWLFTIATTAFLSDPRRGPRGSLAQEQAAEVRSAAPIHIDRFDTQTLRREVEAFVDTLSRQQWAALVQRKYLNLGYAEIAATLSCSEAVARASVYEAVRAMRAHIGDRL